MGWVGGWGETLWGVLNCGIGGWLATHLNIYHARNVSAAVKKKKRRESSSLRVQRQEKQSSYSAVRTKFMTGEKNAKTVVAPNSISV